MWVLGVDPGISGGLAVVEITDGAAPVLVDHRHSGRRRRRQGSVDVAAVCNFIDQHDVQHAFVERTQAMPRQGSSSGLKSGAASAPSRRRSR